MSKIFGKLQKSKTKIVVLIFSIIVASFVFFIRSDNNKNIELNTSNLNNYKSLSDVEIGTVTLNYLDEEGNTIKESSIMQGNVGETYYFKREDISGYTYIGDEPITKAGKYELGNIDVNFIYKKSETELEINAENKGIDGAEENAVNIKINNFKRRNECPVKIITVDEQGNKINGGEFEFYSEENELLRSGKVINDDFYVGVITLSKETEKTYKIVQTKATAGYVKVKDDISLNLEIQWDNEKKEYNVNNVNANNAKAYKNNNGEIIVEVTNSKYTDMYEMEIVYKTSTEMLSGKTIKVQKNSETILEDKVENGKLAVGSFEVTGFTSEVFVITEGNELTDRYKQILTAEQPGKVYVQTIYNNEKDEYELQVTYDEIDGFLVNYDKSSKKIIVYIETEMHKYDLAIKKFISSIDGQETDRAPKTSIENKKVLYDQPTDIAEAANNQLVTYTIRIYNESEVTGYGKQIIEYIPDGLVFLPENETNKKYNWQMYETDSSGNLYKTDDVNKAKIVVTDYLVNMPIDKIDYESEKVNNLEVQAVFKVDETKLTSQDRIIENKVEIKKNDNDDNNNNDTTTEKLYVKYFDLNMKKYIKRVIVTNKDGEETKDIPENEQKSVQINVNKSDIDSTTLTITYVLQVKNVGEIEGYATEITELIPNDFELIDSDGIWTVDGNIAKTTSLSKVLLNPGETKEIEVTFKWNLTEENIGIRSNEAKITSYSNTYDAKDLTDDNTDSSTIEVVLINDIYDLAIKKYVAQIDGENTNREPEVKVENGEVKYSQTNEMARASNNQEVTYGIQIYNESEVTGYGKRIIEYVPDGLVYLPENEINKKFEWVMYAQNSQGSLYRTEDENEAVILVTDYLVNKEISGRDNENVYNLEVQISFKVDETKITSEDRIIENTVIIWKNNNDDNSDNDKTTEKLYIKYFDLDIKKYIKQVVITNDDGEKIKEVKNKDELVKIDIKKSKVNNTTLTITYELEVKNIGEIEGYATELIDYIPESFELVEDGNWKLNKEENIATTTKLENKLLQPGETATIPITFKWKLTEENIGSRINEAKIAKYENPYQATALTTDENNGKIEILSTVKTGGLWYCMTAVVIVAILSPITIVVIKKYKNKV